MIGSPAWRAPSGCREAKQDQSVLRWSAPSRDEHNLAAEGAAAGATRRWLTRWSVHIEHGTIILSSRSHDDWAVVSSRRSSSNSPIQRCVGEGEMNYDRPCSPHGDDPSPAEGVESSDDIPVPPIATHRSGSATMHESAHGRKTLKSRVTAFGDDVAHRRRQQPTGESIDPGPAFVST